MHMELEKRHAEKKNLFFLFSSLRRLLLNVLIYTSFSVSNCTFRQSIEPHQEDELCNWNQDTPRQLTLHDK
jgi:hypothetical protein